MSKARPPSVRHLPVVHAAWEMALVDSPFELQEGRVLGVFLVVEADSGMIRASEVLVSDDDETLASVILRAVSEPLSPCAPGRPAVVNADDPDLVARMQRRLEGSGLAFQEVLELPALSEVALAMEDHFAGSLAPGVTVHLDAWRRVLRALVEQAPWSRVGDEVLFRFQSPITALNNAVVVLMGLLGELEGMVFFPTEHDHAEFLQVATEGKPNLDALAGITTFNLHFDDREDVSDAEIAECVVLDMVLPGPTYPRLVAVRGGRGELLSEDEQTLLLMAVEAVQQACADHLVALEAGETVTHVAHVTGGLAVTVRTEVRPDAEYEVEDREPILAEVEHAVHIAEYTVLPPDHRREPGKDPAPDDYVKAGAVVVQVRKKEVEDVVDLLAGIDTLAFTLGLHEPYEAGFVAWCGPHSMGSLSLGYLHDQRARALQDLALRSRDHEGHVLLCVASGGARRLFARPREVEHYWWVKLVRGD